MLRNKDIAKCYLCRRCLNKHSKIRFRNYELLYKYYYYHFRCSECDEMHHIVKAVKPMYRWKLLFANKPNNLTKEEREVEKAMKRKTRRYRLKKWLNL